MFRYGLNCSHPRELNPCSLQCYIAFERYKMLIEALYPFLFQKGMGITEQYQSRRMVRFSIISQSPVTIS